MRHSWRAAWVGALVALPLAGCDRFLQQESPQITAVAPAEVQSGQTIVVQGEGFSATPHENVVLFGNKTGRVVGAVTTELRVEVPTLDLAAAAGARVAVRVKVGGRESNGLVLDVLAGSQVAALEPTEGDIAAGEDPAAEGAWNIAEEDAGTDGAEPDPTSPAPAAPRSTPPPAPAPSSASARAAQSASAPAADPAPEPPAATRRAPAPKPASASAPAAEPVEPADLSAASAPVASDRSFVTGPTRLLEQPKGRGAPAGFDTSGVEVADQKKRARFEVEVSPDTFQPGQPYRARVSLTNLGKDKLRVESLRTVVIAGNDRSSRAIALRNKEVEPGETEFLADVPGSWPEGGGSWALEIVARARNDEYEARVDWR